MACRVSFSFQSKWPLWPTWPLWSTWPYWSRWPCMPRHGHIWPYMTIYGHVWPYMTIHGHAWPDMAIYGHVWPCIAVCGHACPDMAIYGHVWPCMAVCGHAWPDMAMYKINENPKSKISFRCVKLRENPENLGFTFFVFLPPYLGVSDSLVYLKRRGLKRSIASYKKFLISCLVARYSTVFVFKSMGTHG